MTLDREEDRGAVTGPAEVPYEPTVRVVDLLTWIGQAKRRIALATLIGAAVGVALAFVLTPQFTATATLLAPASQQQSSTAAALASLGSLGGLAGGMAGRSPDELYVALLRSESVERGLADRFDLRTRYDVKTFEALRKAMEKHIRVNSDKKSGLISVDVDDEDAAFAATLANAHKPEVDKVLARLAVTEAQRRRVFFEHQLQDTKESLIRAEETLQRVQEKSGLIVLDKQAEALVGSAADVRARIAEREVELKVLRTAATEQNPQVMRLNSELQALRGELARIESAPGKAGSAVDMPVDKLPESAVDFVRAKREVKLQESLLEAMVRQYELARLDEAKEGQELQAVDVAVAPDRKSKPARSLIVAGAALLALLGSLTWFVVRRYLALLGAHDPGGAASLQTLRRAWSWGR